MPSIPAILLVPFKLGRYPNSLQNPELSLKGLRQFHMQLYLIQITPKIFWMHLRILQLIHTYSVRVLNETAVLNSNLVGEKDVK